VAASLALIFLCFNLVCCGNAEAQLASRFSLSIAEEFNDNIFFTKQKEHDFITHIIPTLTLLYRSASDVEPRFRLDISPTAQIFARHSEENTFGKDTTLEAGYTYFYSPRLTFNISDALQSRGDTRTAGLGINRHRRQPGPSTEPPRPGILPFETLGDFISNGETLGNSFSIDGRYLYAPDITIGGSYNSGYTAFFDEGGSELTHSINFMSSYKWRQQHNLHAGYTLTSFKSRDGENNVVHNLDVGDDYFSNTQIQLTPTTTVAFSGGIALNTGRDGPRVANNANLLLTKVWQTTTFTIGARKELTNSYGVSGLSDTISVFTNFNVRLTERLSGRISADYSRFDTDDVKFNTLQTSAGLQYAMTTWLCSSLNYLHRRLDSGRGSGDTDLLMRGDVYGSSAFVAISASFDVWPSVGLAKNSTACHAGTRHIASRQSPAIF
jgi:hypothetical protein